MRAFCFSIIFPDKKRHFLPLIKWRGQSYTQILSLNGAMFWEGSFQKQVLHRAPFMAWSRQHRYRGGWNRPQTSTIDSCMQGHRALLGAWWASCFLYCAKGLDLWLSPGSWVQTSMPGVEGLLPHTSFYLFVPSTHLGLDPHLEGPQEEHFRTIPTCQGFF